MAKCWKRGGTKFCVAKAKVAGMKCKRNPKTGYMLCTHKGVGGMEGLERARKAKKRGRKRAKRRSR